MRRAARCRNRGPDRRSPRPVGEGAGPSRGTEGKLDINLERAYMYVYQKKSKYDLRLQEKEA